MKIILLNSKHGQSRSIALGGWSGALISCFALLAVVGLSFFLGQKSSQQESGLDEATVATLKARAQSERQQWAVAKRESEQQIQALTLKMASMQAQLVRLDALGERLTSMAKLDSGEFDFSQLPPLGGPEKDVLSAELAQPDFMQAIDHLVARIDNREQQLGVLETLLANRKIRDDVFLAGRPIRKGWMSSRFGQRNDPFSGRLAMHEGVDFAGKLGSDIIAVAAGVVTWSGERYGYGQMVEINHGDGFMTRYAHNQANKVEVGEIVKKGQLIALMGSSGRSTGPHVHFEVYKHGRPVDPAAYIHRAAR